jgi:hypothetical protein
VPQASLDEKPILAALRVLCNLSQSIDQLVEQLVVEAGARGATWRQIGDALGVSASAAHQRHSKRRR